MTQPDTTLAGVPRGAGGVAASSFGAAEAWGIVVSVLYIAVAGVLTGWWHLGSGEALARTAHIGNLWGGFDQTALAFGLERPPLLSALALPFGMMPILRDQGLAAALGTASAGGLGVIAASSLARWAGFGVVTHALFTIAFVAHPLLVLSAASGLPEALYASLLLVALTQFMRWADRDAIAPVIVSGATLGLAFMVRYNVVFIAAALALAYLVVARNRGDRSDRIERSQATTFAFLVPVVFVAGFWVITSWFATGSAFGFLREASRLSDLAGNDPMIAERMRDMRGDPIEVLQWLGRWLPLLATPSLLAIAALVLTGLVRRSVTALALGLVLASLVLPEAISLLAGHGQPRVPHLFALVVPVFIAVAYLERSRTQGRRPEEFERGALRRQAVLAVFLLVTSAASVAAFPFFPREDSPGRELADRVRDGRLTSVAANSESVATTAEWIRANAQRGDVIVDPERSAEVMVATRNFSRFRTPTDDGGLAVVADPSSTSRFLLARRPVAGRGALERIYPRLFEAGAPTLTLEFQAGDYRIYRVQGAE